MTPEQERRLLNNQSLRRKHPQQYVLFYDPDILHLDFTKPVSCDLAKRQQVSKQLSLDNITHIVIKEAYYRSWSVLLTVK